MFNIFKRKKKKKQVVDKNLAINFWYSPIILDSKTIKDMTVKEDIFVGDITYDGIKSISIIGNSITKDNAAIGARYSFFDSEQKFHALIFAFISAYDREDTDLLMSCYPNSNINEKYFLNENEELMVASQYIKSENELYPVYLYCVNKMNQLYKVYFTEQLYIVPAYINTIILNNGDPCRLNTVSILSMPNHRIEVEIPDNLIPTTHILCAYEDKENDLLRIFFCFQHPGQDKYSFSVDFLNYSPTMKNHEFLIFDNIDDLVSFFDNTYNEDSEFDYKNNNFCLDPLNMLDIDYKDNFDGTIVRRKKAFIYILNEKESISFLFSKYGYNMLLNHLKLKI